MWGSLLFIITVVMMMMMPIAAEHEYINRPLLFPTVTGSRVRRELKLAVKFNTSENVTSGTVLGQVLALGGFGNFTYVLYPGESMIIDEIVGAQH